MSNFTGVYRGVIHDLTDPAKRGRARLLVPAIYGNAVSGWANPVFTNSSTSVGDLAWVMFENADINRPVWLSVQPGPNLEELDARYYTETEVNTFLNAKQNTLDRGDLLGNENLNDIVTPGSYRVWPGVTNQPLNVYSYGMLTVYKGSGSITQMYIADQTGDDVNKGVWIRTDWGSDGWGSWRQLSLVGRVIGTAELPSSVVHRVVHGAVANTARPAVTYVEWMGSVVPTNATPNDTWVNTTP